MNYKDELISLISTNLNLRKFSCEDEKSYISRVLYSAIAIWIYTAAQDITLGENYGKGKNGVSKKYITRRVSNIVNEYQELFPEFRPYLDGLEAADIVRILRRTIERAGFLIPTGFDENIALPRQKSMKVSEKIYLNKGLCEANGITAIGLGLYSNFNSNQSCVSMRELFCIPTVCAKTWTVEYINSINWRNSSKLSNAIDFFNPKSPNIFSACWQDKFPLGVAVTIYRIHDRDYGFARLEGGQVKGVQIPDHLIGVLSSDVNDLFDNEVRRFMYGLKGLYNKAKARVIIENDCCILNLYNALPSRELTAIRFMGWPKIRIRDNYHYFISPDLLPCIKELLGNLNIDLEEVHDG